MRHTKRAHHASDAMLQYNVDPLVLEFCSWGRPQFTQHTRLATTARPTCSGNPTTTHVSSMSITTNRGFERHWVVVQQTNIHQPEQIQSKTPASIMLKFLGQSSGFIYGKQTDPKRASCFFGAGRVCTGCLGPSCCSELGVDREGSMFLHDVFKGVGPALWYILTSCGTR